MNYIELAGMLPQELRERIESETVYTPWLKTGGSLERLWQDDVVLETVYNRLSAAERELLELIVRRMGCTPFDDALLVRSAEARLSKAEIRAGCAGLRRKGLIFAFRKSWGELLYLLPEDGFARWQRILYGNMYRIPQATEPPEELQDGLDPVLPLFDLLVYAAKHGLKLTRSGTLTKRAIQRIAELVSWQEPGLQGLALKYVFADVYPLKVALALDMGLKLNLLIRRDEELEWQTDALYEFLAMPRSAQNNRLYEWWKDISFPSAVWLQHAVLLIEAWPVAQPFESWRIVELLAGAGLLAAPEEPQELEERIRLLQLHWLEPLCVFGWMERITDPAGRPDSDIRSPGTGHYRWVRHPGQPDDRADGEAGRLVVQPDFDILVPPDVPLLVQWELCSLAQEPARDVLSVSKLTKSSIKFALQNGRTAEDVIAFLERQGAYGLPENVRLTIQQWAKPFGLTNIAHVTLLRCADADTARTLGRLPAVSGLLGEPLGDKDYLIHTGDVKALAAALEKAGFMAGLPSSTELGGSKEYPAFTHETFCSPTAIWPELQRKGQGLVYARHSAGYFQLDSHLPETSDLYPDLRDIPAAWLKEYRSYHPSIRKEMVEKAIELGSILQIRKDGADHRIVPRKLQETRGTWCLTGMEAERYPERVELALRRAEDRGRSAEIRLLSGEWQEMKLILPGVNDK
ncbi:helicase-associated domain-containing protein [Paenibacillus puerhi]|uniref:helicase-associated domain-containing protein n=1 Tax=Paenibacillus puerhi TaxID=2692622 RepID=UPI001357441B|nr:helicase-associated domain-containing protein [Paenibacillus puerhi]